MSKTGDYTNLSQFMVERRLMKAMDELDKLEALPVPTDPAEKTTHEEKITWTEKLRDDLDAEMMRREKESKAELKAEREARETKYNASPPSMNHGQVGISNTEMNMKLKTISEAVNGLEKFGPGSEPSTFVRNIKSLKMLAKCKQTESFMVGMLFTRLSDEYKPTYAKYAEEHACTTVDDFVKYINTQYESRKSIYQFMEELDSVQLRQNECMRDFGTRLEQKMFELETAVKAKFIELKKRKEPEFDGDMTTDDVFKMFTGMSLIKALQPNKGLYTHVMTKADDCFSALDLANIADAYTQRSQDDEGTVMHARGQSGSNNQDRSQPAKRRGPIGVCWGMHFDNKCANGPSCRWCNKKDGGNKNGNGGRNGQRQNNRQNQNKRADAGAKPSAPPAPAEPESNYIQGAQVYGADFR